MDAQALIDHLQLAPHVEGGFFRRIYTSPQTSPTVISPGQSPVADNQPRSLMSSIVYLLCNAQPKGYLHRNRSDILHFWQRGRAIRYTLLSSDGQLRCATLGPDLDSGQQLSLLVPGGVWKASELLPQAEGEADYGLVGEAVSPGFDYRDHQLATADDLRQQYPAHWPMLAPLIKRDEETS